ncbi:MAG: TagF domain-containing protein [Pseudomonadota bacterium]
MTGWQCGLLGKHPASPDYLCLGPAAHQLAAVFSWIRAGFTVPVLKALAAHPVAAGWCFWMLPEGETRLICGVFKASCDSCGRPAPLLIAGAGRTVAAEETWDALTEASGDTWKEMETLADGRHYSAETLTDGLARIPAPPEKLRAPRLDSVEKALIMEEVGRHLKAARASRRIGVRLEGDRYNRWQRLLGWQRALQEKMPIAPYSLFYCEPAGHFELFYRPLNRRDGIRLIEIALSRHSTAFPED